MAPVVPPLKSLTIPLLITCPKSMYRSVTIPYRKIALSTVTSCEWDEGIIFEHMKAFRAFAYRFSDEAGNVVLSVGAPNFLFQAVLGTHTSRRQWRPSLWSPSPAKPSSPRFGVCSSPQLPSESPQVCNPPWCLAPQKSRSFPPWR